MRALHMVAYILLFVGGLNWGLMGLFQYNVVEALFGAGSGLSMIIYDLVGLATVYIILTHKSDCMVCMGKKKK